ncbi:MAG: hypothetical protein A3J55_02075 [Candidatus Ryanbacteria bacterium RIFCSPHIGHO2_02_FULL_45_17b]|uniref:Methyltransferase domain-containing protein n=1 Tax=Candidatus Ryanbacteria bacterium RIFCSPHIGHO2_01_FULL_45_22 TaxID=1802114 RepID=A0A1G2FZZ8_9BACT|nr:MAG: hypothetical protein A2719_00520 [Candidatus Ryanbacteria bacterium RIFCSPHIGHO2_01_FULL_45_22]OGZ46728.1 MAG: hypothetical protein A3J55_02075 [Candidatus Ryanbacteria bacterium RIFCSPHIGHO2_02_FULL_45_17b]
MKTDYRISHQSEQVSRVYDEVLYKQGTYDDALWRWEQCILEKEITLLQTKATPISLLDFACGTGRILTFLENKVNNAVGVDIAEEMLSRARQVVQNARLIKADLTRIDALRGEPFDLVTAFRFFLNAEPVLREEAMAVLFQKLRNQDSLLIFNIHGNLWSHRVFTKIGLWFRGKRLSVSTRREMELLARRHGLEMARWYGFGILPKIAYRVIGSRIAHGIDKILSHIPGMRFISYDLVFVCKKGIVKK